MGRRELGREQLALSSQTSDFLPKGYGNRNCCTWIGSLRAHGRLWPLLYGLAQGDSTDPGLPPLGFPAAHVLFPFMVLSYVSKGSCLNLQRLSAPQVKPTCTLVFDVLNFTSTHSSQSLLEQRATLEYINYNQLLSVIGKGRTKPNQVNVSGRFCFHTSYVLVWARHSFPACNFRMALPQLCSISYI